MAGGGTIRAALEFLVEGRGVARGLKLSVQPVRSGDRRMWFLMTGGNADFVDLRCRCEISVAIGQIPEVAGSRLSLLVLREYSRSSEADIRISFDQEI